MNPVEQFANDKSKMNDVITKKNSHPSVKDVEKLKIRPNHREKWKTE